MNIEYLKKDNLETIRRLIIDYEFNDYRNYRVLKKKMVNECLFKQIEDLLSVNKGISVVVFKKGKDAAGLIILTDLPWDSKHFGFKMAEITYLIAKGSYEESYKIKRSLVSFILRMCRQNGTRHLSCKIDTADFSSIHVLEESDFKIMDTLLTYIFNRFKHKIPNLKKLYKTRPFKRKDLNTLLKLAQDSFLNSRYYRDALLPREKADRLHREWVKNYCSNLKDNRAFVAEKGNKVVGFIIYKKNRELKKLCGTKVVGNGLSAGSPVAKGAYIALIETALEDVILSSHDIAEFDTQVINYEVIKVYQKFKLDFVRSKYTFHKWLTKV